MDTRFQRLCQVGVGTEVKHAAVISDQEDGLFWTTDEQHSAAYIDLC